MLGNRLRPILGDIISPEQSAFVPSRLITDNAIIAFECIHAIQRGSGGRKEFCAYKLDLSKAYDRVDWGFLESLLVKLGVGDSHKGPLKNRGKPIYFRKKQNTNEFTNLKHAQDNHGPATGPTALVAPAAHQNSRPNHPQAKLHFARGAQRRTSESPPRSRAGRPLG
jgi:hypothetical protein